MLVTSRFSILTLILMAASSLIAATEEKYRTAEPQPAGWPLTEEERAFVLKPEFERRPGAEQMKHLPALWPVVPSAGFFGGTSWIDMHTSLVKDVEARPGPVDVLLIGDSLMQQWGGQFGKPLIPAWTQNFPNVSAINIGIGGDKTQNVLWRLEHGGVKGLEPRVVVLLIGNNNMYFTPETGIEPAARGVQSCVANIREKFPKAHVIAVKILPASTPGQRFYEDLVLTNAAIDRLKLDSDPQVHVLDLWKDFVDEKGFQIPGLFGSDGIHLAPAGYEVFATRLKPLIEPLVK